MSTLHGDVGEGTRGGAEPAALPANLRSLALTDDQAALIWLGQSGFAVRMRDTTLLIDPFLSSHPDRAVAPPFSARQAVGVDAILCTHEHIDHFDADAVREMARASPTAVIVVPRPIVSLVAEQGIDRRRIIGVQPDERIDVGTISVIPVPARHGVNVEDAYTFGQELSDGLYRYLGYVIQGGDVRIYHAGDTIRYEGMETRLRCLGIDVALLPINGRDPERERQNLVGNMDALEAAELANAMRADVFVPMHHDMFPGNLGFPGRAVEAVVQNRWDVAVLVPTLARPFVYTKPGSRS